MLQFFRNFFGSKLGAAITLGFVVLMGLAFASGDIASSGSFGGVAGGDRVATVGKARIDTAELERASANAVEQLRADDPKITIKSFLAQGGLEQVLDNLIDLAALRSFGEKYGIQVGDRLVDSEIAKIPGVQGPDGKVSEQLYRAWLGQQRLTEAQLRDELSQQLMGRQLLTSTQLGVAVPQEALLRYASVVAEQRTGAIALLPAAVFAPQGAPSDADVAAFYKANQGDYARPERRTVRFATFDDSVLKDVPAPTEAEIAARYTANKAQYAATESRRVSQLILPTEAAAKAVLAEISGGKSLDAVAAAKGLSIAGLGTLTREGLSGQTSQAVADAAFGAASGKVAGPVRSPLGWALLRVDGIENKAGRSLDQVRGELVAQIAVDKRRAALTDFSARIEEEFDNGATLTDVAREQGLTITETAPVLADGQIYGKPGETAPPILARVLSTVFSMENERQAQLAEVEPGKTLVVFDVGAIQAAAPAPLAEIRATVAADFQLAKGNAAARAAAQKIEAQVRKGGDLAAAMASLGLPLPPVDRVAMSRLQLRAMGADKVPPPLALLFSLHKGGVKLMGAPRNRGWYVVQAQDIVPGKVVAGDPRLAGFKQSIEEVLAREYSRQMRGAMRADVGVKRNESAIKAVRTSLQGGN